MNDIKKPTHLAREEMSDLLTVIGSTGIRRALGEWEKGKRPKNFNKFRRANGWVLVDDAKRDYAHRPLIALACELCNERVMNPNNFGLPNDNICKDWFVAEGFTLKGV